MKEVVTDAALASVWKNRTPRQVSRTGVNGNTPGKNCNAISVIELTSPVMIGIVGTSPPCSLNVIQQISNKQQSTSSGLVRQTQKLDAVVDGKSTDDLN